MGKFIIVAGIIWLSTLGATTKDKDNWKQNMQLLRSNIMQISPYLYSESEFQKKENYKTLSNALKSLQNHSHKLNPNSQKDLSKFDPSLKYMVDGLNEDIKLAVDAFNEKKFHFSQTMLRAALNQCFHCHTQTFSKNQWTGQWEKNKKVKFLKPSEKADFLIAMRDFDTARKEILSSLADESYVIQKSYEVEKAINKYLYISVLVHHSKEKTQELVDQLNTHKKLPEYLKRFKTGIEKSIQDWNDKKIELNIGEAEKILEAGNKKQEYMSDTVSYIENLRAAYILHQVLKSHKLKTEELAKSYYLLGLSYQNLNDPLYWDLNERYFRQCIESLPHSKLSQSCFHQYKDSVEFRHSGSSGTYIPLRLKLRLSELKKKSQIK